MKLNAAEKKLLKVIKAECIDMYRTHPRDIEKNEFLHVGANVFAKMKFLINLVDGKPTGVGDNKVAEPEEEEFDDAYVGETAEV